MITNEYKLLYKLLLRNHENSFRDGLEKAKRMAQKKKKDKDILTELANKIEPNESLVLPPKPAPPARNQNQHRFNKNSSREAGSGRGNGRGRGRGKRGKRKNDWYKDANKRQRNS